MRRENTQAAGTCTRCEQPYEHGQVYCSCGRPTPFATFADRAAYEVQQWRQHLEATSQSA